MKYVKVLFWLVLAFGLYVNTVETLLVLAVSISLYLIFRYLI